MHGGHIMKKPRKSQCYISHNLVSSNHTSFIEGFPGKYDGHYSHTQHAYKHTFTHAYTPKYILKIVFLIQVPEDNSFYFKEFDVFNQFMSRW